MMNVLLTLVYVAVAMGGLTGVLLLPLPDNSVLKLLHRTSGPLSNFLFAIYYVLFQFAESGPKQRVVLAACFMLLAYSGLVTAKEAPEKKDKIVHALLGAATLLAFSFVYFSFLMLWTGAAASLGEVF